MASENRVGEIASARHLSARTLLTLEIAVLVALTACGLFYFFGKTFESGFAVHPGDLGDWRYNNVIAEHWFSVLKGEARWRSPIFFYPAKGMLGYSDAIFLFIPFYVPFRLLGIDAALAFALCFMCVVGFGFVASYWFMSRIMKLPKVVSFGASFAFAFSSMAAARYPHAALYANAFLPVLFGFGARFFESILARQASIVAGIGIVGHPRLDPLHGILHRLFHDPLLHRFRRHLPAAQLRARLAIDEERFSRLLGLANGRRDQRAEFRDRHHPVLGDLSACATQCRRARLGHGGMHAAAAAGFPERRRQCVVELAGQILPA